MRFFGPLIPRAWKGFKIINPGELNRPNPNDQMSSNQKTPDPKAANAMENNLAKKFLNMPDTVHLGIGPFVNGKIIGFEYFSWMPGLFKIKVRILLKSHFVQPKKSIFFFLIF